jgi:hypothetical protein
VDVDLGLRLSPGSRAEPHGNARGRYGCIRQELAARMIFGPARSLRRAKDAALTFHEPVALHHAHSGGAWTRRGTSPTPWGTRVGAARTIVPCLTDRSASFVAGSAKSEREAPLRVGGAWLARRARVRRPCLRGA